MDLANRIERGTVDSGMSCEVLYSCMLISALVESEFRTGSESPVGLVTYTQVEI